MDNAFTEIGSLQDTNTGQDFAILRHNSQKDYFLINDLSTNLDYFYSLNDYDRGRFKIIGMVANTIISTNDYVTVEQRLNVLTALFRGIFKPSNDPSLIKFSSWLEKAKISDIDKFINCTKIIRSYQLDSDEIPENPRDDLFDQKIFAYVLAEFEYDGKLQQKLFMQITERKEWTSIRHFEVTWDIYHFSRLKNIQKHFFVQRLI